LLQNIISICEDSNASFSSCYCYAKLFRNRIPSETAADFDLPSEIAPEEQVIAEELDDPQSVEADSCFNGISHRWEGRWVLYDSVRASGRSPRVI